MRDFNIQHGSNNEINIDNRQMISDEKWYQKWWIQLAFTIIGGLIIAFFTYKFGWNKSS